MRVLAGRLVCSRSPLRCSVLALGASAALADTGNVIEPQNEPPTGANGWLAGTCDHRLAALLAGDPRSVLHAGRRTPPDRLHPVHHPAPGSAGAGKTPVPDRQRRSDRPAAPQPGDQDAPGRRAAGPDRQPAGRAALLPRGLRARARSRTRRGENRPRLRGSLDPRGRGTDAGDQRSGHCGRTRTPLAALPPARDRTPRRLRDRTDPGPQQSPVYNLEPKDGEPALFGFVVAGEEVVFLETEVAWEGDFHQSFTISPPEPEVPGLSTLISRLVNFGAAAGDGSYINNPTTCFDPADPANEIALLDLVQGRVLRRTRPELPVRVDPVRGEGAGLIGQTHPAARLRGSPVRTRDRRRPRHLPGRLAGRGDGHHDARVLRRRRERDPGVPPAQGGGRAAAGHVAQPRRGERAARLHRRPVQEGGAHLRQRMPARLEDRQRRDRVPAAAPRLAEGRHIRRHAEELRPGLGRTVQDPDRSEVREARRRRPPDRQRQRRSRHRPAHHHVRRNRERRTGRHAAARPAAGAVRIGEAALRQGQKRVDQPADLRPAPDHQLDGTVVGPRHRQAPVQLVRA